MTELVVFSKGVNHAEKSIRCSFCDEEYASSTIGDHLMLCGNKTDQCPKCQKYIRRAVFAYHYENDCANLDESDVDTDRRTARKSDAPSAIHNPSQSTSTPVNRGDREVATVVIDLSQHPTHQRITPSVSTNTGRFLFIFSTLCAAKLFRSIFVRWGMFIL